MNFPYKTSIDERLIFYVIIPHVNFPYKTSIDERLREFPIQNFHRRTTGILQYHPLLLQRRILPRVCHSSGDIIEYQGGHMMRNADARTVRSRQETFNSNGGHDA